MTRSQGNVIYEIDGKPAIEVLKEYLPEDALADDRDWMRYAISLALSFKAPSYMKDEEYVVRGVPAVKMADGSITVQTEVTEGTSVWFSSRDKEKITTGLRSDGQPRSRSNSGVSNPNSSSSLSVSPEAN